MQSPIYLINLERSVERLTCASQRLQQARINFERLPAIDGSSLSASTINQFYCAQLNSKQYYKTLTVGEIGCYLSHRKAWQKIANGNAPFGFVIEDDIEVVGDFIAALHTITSLDFEWDMIKLSAYKNKTRAIAHKVALNAIFNLVVHTKPMTGCAAYAVTKQAALKLLANSEKFGRPVDTDIQHFWEKQVNVFSLMPYVIKQDLSFASEIANRKGNRSSRRLQRIQQQCSAFIRNKIAISRLVRKLSFQQISATNGTTNSALG